MNTFLMVVSCIGLCNISESQFYYAPDWQTCLTWAEDATEELGARAYARCMKGGVRDVEAEVREDGTGAWQEFDPR